jgi:ribosomal protein S18 acetylase RimI-like enzyme
MNIGRFQESDAAAVSELIRTTLQISNSRDYPPEIINALIERETPDHILQRASWTHFYVAEDDSKIIGCGAIGPYWDRQDESSLFTIFVHPDFQGKGVGKAIVETLERDEFALRAKRIEIPASITGLPFYQKMGYSFKDGITELDEERLHRLEKCRKTIIRVMDIEDYDRVYALWMSCKNMGFNNLDDSRQGIEKYLKRNPSTCFIAEQDDAIVGVVLAGHDGRRGFIHHMAVAEHCRRQGIATDLLDQVLAALKKEGINKTALLVFNRNEAGNAFWERQGFTARDDVTYRNKTLTEMIRIDT